MLPAGSMVEPEKAVLLICEKNPMALPFLTGGKRGMFNHYSSICRLVMPPALFIEL